MKRQRKGAIGQALAMAVGLGILLFGLSGCKDSTTPDGNENARLRVNNDSGIAVDVYMDGTFQFFLNQKEYYYIENVALGTHLLEAKKKDTQTLLKSVSAEITEKQDYTWTIRSSAVVTVTNNYGETISLYDYYDNQETYQTDIADQLTATLTNIYYGQHVFRVKRPDQSEVLTEIPLEIFEDKTYALTIQK